MPIFLNDIDIIGLKVIGLVVDDTYYREAAKSGVSFSQGEGYQVRKAGARTIVLKGVLQTASYAQLQEAVAQLTELLGSEGTKSVESNGVYYEVFAKDGFKVSGLIQKTGNVSALLDVNLTQIGPAVVNPEWLLDGETGEFVLDAEGRRILDLS